MKATGEAALHDPGVCDGSPRGVVATSAMVPAVLCVASSREVFLPVAFLIGDVEMELLDGTLRRGMGRGRVGALFDRLLLTSLRGRRLRAVLMTHRLRLSISSGISPGNAMSPP